MDHKINNSDLSGTSENKDIIPSSGNFNKDDNSDNDNNDDDNNDDDNSDDDNGDDDSGDDDSGDKDQGMNNRVKYFGYNYINLLANSLKRVVKKNLKTTSIDSEAS